MAGKLKLSPRDEMLLSLGLVLAAVIGWYFALYQPVAAKSADLREHLDGLEDSVAAIARYKAEVTAYNIKTEKLKKELETWDARFPPRSQIVNLTNQFIAFAERRGLNLIDVQPSLFELYALERAGAQVSGKYVMQLPLRFRFAGSYLNVGRLLEEVEALPFNVSLSELKMEPLEDRYPLLRSEMNVFLYVHL